MRPIELKQYRLDYGKHCFVHRGRLNEILAVKYGRDPQDTCVKIFDTIEIKNEQDFYTKTWGDKPQGDEPLMANWLFAATQIQNIANMLNCAPKVYGLETVKLGDKLYAAQFCEFVDGEFWPTDRAYDQYKEIKKELEKFGIINEKDDVSDSDVIDGWLIDFNTFHFDPNQLYLNTVKEIYIESGRYGKVYYQDEPKLGLSGAPRKSPDRIGYLKLDNIDFDGKNVMDVGCAGGYFCRYADDHGARRIIGLDTPETIKAAQHVSNFLGRFNIDYFESGEDGDFTLPWGEFPDTEFHIVFFLSMYMHIGLPDRVIERMADDGIMIFEKNGRESDADVEKLLRSKFNEVELVGHGKDHGNKPIYHCRRPKR